MPPISSIKPKKGILMLTCAVDATCRWSLYCPSSYTQYSPSSLPIAEV